MAESVHVLFCVSIDLDFLLAPKKWEKKLGQYSPILAIQAWSVMHLSFGCMRVG